MATAVRNLTPLVRFGALMEQDGQVAVDVGGVLVPGPDFSAPFKPGMEEYSDGRSGDVAGEGARVGARAGERGEGAQAEAEASAGAASRSIRRVTSLTPGWHGHDITSLELEGLEDLYPDIRVTSSSSRLIYLGLSIQPFLSIPDRAQLVLEVPRPGMAGATRIPNRASLGDLLANSSLPWRPPGAEVGQLLALVPAVRAWARWIGGPADGMAVLSHHCQPDLSICACMPHQWIRGIHPLVAYAGMCVTWFARLLHERDLGVYPGRQHYPEWSRLERDRRHEYCGCGGTLRYADCHRESDRRLDASKLKRDREQTRRAYYFELLRQRRPATPPAEAWR